MNMSTTTVATDIALLLRRIRSKGVCGTCRAVADRIEAWGLERYFEWKLGIATTGFISSEALGYGRPDCHHYEACCYGSISRIMKALDVQKGQDVFVDFGSGKGRVLIFAAMHRFRRVIGIDRSTALNDIARHNVQRARKWMACQDVEVVTSDAAAYALPDDATVMFFAYPFGGEILREVLANIEASLRRAPRRLLLINHGDDPGYPFGEQFRSCPWLHRCGEVRLPRSIYAGIYTNARWHTRAAVSAA